MKGVDPEKQAGMGYPLFGGCIKQNLGILSLDGTSEVIRVTSLQVHKSPVQFISSLASDFQPFLGCS